MDVHWKTSVLEPSETLTDILFESIFNQNGTFTWDWDGTRILDPAEILDSYDVRRMKFDPLTGEKI